MCSSKWNYSIHSDAEDQEVLFGQILTGYFEYRSPYWDSVSESAKHLIQQLINVNVDKRLFAQEALEHDWIKVINTKVTVVSVVTTAHVYQITVFSDSYSFIDEMQTEVINGWFLL